MIKLFGRAAAPEIEQPVAFLEAMPGAEIAPAADTPTLIAMADAARDRQDWTGARGYYARVVALEPGNSAMHVQLGHAAKESGDLAAALTAYRAAVALAPDDGDAWLQLGHAAKLDGQRDAAIAAYARAQYADAACSDAVRELVALGVRNHVDDDVRTRLLDKSWATLAEAAAGHALALRNWTTIAPFPRRAYAAFRAQLTIPPPPMLPNDVIALTIRAQDTDAAALRVTLVSLQNQTMTRWTARIDAPAALRSHPVASLVDRDARLSWSADVDRGGGVSAFGAVVAGTQLDPAALAWLSYALDTGADAVVCDHDRCTRAGLARVHADPVLAAAVDPFLIASASSDFPVALFRARADGPMRTQVLAARRPLHVPLLLATVFADEGRSTSISPAISEVPPSDAAIMVVIPTRAQSAQLARCLASLRMRAARPERVRIHVVANRADTETTALIRDGVATGQLTTHSDDRAFNWSALNNGAAGHGDAPLLLFLNDDTEMLTDGWDARMANALSQPDVGVCGARLLYPDMSVQHAGITLAMADGYPRHAGRGDRHSDGGPQGYWTRRRSVDAVSGACLAVRRDVFDAVGGFDESYPTNHADVLFCLAARALGKAVVYDGTLDLLHAESKTRAPALPGDLAWENDEVAALADRYRSASGVDYSPYWSRHGSPYDGYVAVDAEQAVAIIEAAKNAWVRNPGI